MVYRMLVVDELNLWQIPFVANIKANTDKHDESPGRFCIILFFCCCILCGGANFAHNAAKSYFYVAGSANTFVLSKKIMQTGQWQTFNSLFIWQKTRVTRIIFTYEGKAKNSNGHHLYALDELLNKASYVTLYYKKSLLIGGNEYDDYSLQDDKSGAVKFQDAGTGYTTKLKVLINNWHHQHNPLADELASYYSSEGDWEKLDRNNKRKAAYDNNFPLAFTLPGKDSIYFAKVYFINVYKPDDRVVEKAPLPMEVHRLFSTIDLTDGSFPTGLDRSFDRLTLPCLFKIPLPTDTAHLFDELSGFKQTAHDAGFEPIDHGIYESVYRLAPSKKQQADRAPVKISDTVSKKRKAVKVNIKDYTGLAEYCKACYDTAYSKTERIANHCPIVIFEKDGTAATNWSFAFVKDRRVFFNEQNLSREPLMVITSDDGPCQIWYWQLVSPGLGYWLSNSVNCDAKYDAAAVMYYVNGVRVN